MGDWWYGHTRLSTSLVASQGGLAGDGPGIVLDGPGNGFGWLWVAPPVPIGWILDGVRMALDVFGHKNGARMAQDGFYIVSWMAFERHCMALAWLWMVLGWVWMPLDKPWLFL